MADTVIRVRGLSFSYAPDLLALAEVTFSIGRGERVGIVGASGAGKSTLLLLLAGVLEPRGGSVVVEGIEARREKLAELRRRAGLVFQNPDDMLFMPTVAADVAFGPQNQGLSPAQVDERVHRSLCATGTSALAGRPPWALSGGEKRAVSIATVLAMDPPILLLDEPSAGLDPASRRSLIALVRSLPGTVLAATHDLDFVLDTCERTLLLGSGTVAADGPTADVLGDLSLLASNRLELPLRLQACPRCSARGTEVPP